MFDILQASCKTQLSIWSKYQKSVKAKRTKSWLTSKHQWTLVCCKFVVRPNEGCNLVKHDLTGFQYLYLSGFLWGYEQKIFVELGFGHRTLSVKLLWCDYVTCGRRAKVIWIYFVPSLLWYKGDRDVIVKWKKLRRKKSLGKTKIWAEDVSKTVSVHHKGREYPTLPIPYTPQIPLVGLHWVCYVVVVVMYGQFLMWMVLCYPFVAISHLLFTLMVIPDY